MVYDPGFENEGPLAGDADGWLIDITNDTWGYAAFGAKRWGSDLFESDWGNDDWILEFEPADVDFADFDPADPAEQEDFLYWPALLFLFDNWAAFTSDPADFNSGADEEEDFISADWGVDPWYPSYASWIVGEETENFTVTSTSNKFRIKLEDGTTFDATLTATPAVYTAAALASHLQGLVNTALIAAGAPFAANDIRFIEPGSAPGQIAIMNAKSTYWMTVYTGSDDGWPIILGRTPGLFDYRYFEEDLIDEADHAWVGEYNSDTKDNESFERDWFNSDTTIPWQWMMTLAYFLDATGTEPPGGWVISSGVNDKISMRYRQWGTANVTTTTNAISPGTYTTAQLAAQIQTAINTWLAGAGAPFASGQIICKESPNGTIRLENVGAAFDLVMYVTDEETDLWDYIGMPYDDTDHVEQYLHPETARWTPVTTVRFAVFSPGARQYENFELGW